MKERREKGRCTQPCTEVACWGRREGSLGSAGARLCWVSGCVRGTEPDLGADGKPRAGKTRKSRTLIQGFVGISWEKTRSLDPEIPHGACGPEPGSSAGGREMTALQGGGRGGWESAPQECDPKAVTLEEPVGLGTRRQPQGTAWSWPPLCDLSRL